MSHSASATSGPESEWPGARTFEMYESDDSQPLDLWRYWRMLRNHLWLIVMITALGTFFAVLKVRQAPARYEAGASFAIESAGQQVFPAVEGFVPADQSFFEGRLIQMQLDILQSRSMAERVIARLRDRRVPGFDLALTETDSQRRAQQAAAIDAFLGPLQIARPKDDVFTQRVIRLSYTTPDPQVAATALNTLLDCFIEYNREVNLSRVEDAAQWLALQIQDIETKLGSSRDALLAFQRQEDWMPLGAGAEGDTDHPALQRLIELSRQLSEAESDRLSAEILLRLARERGVDALPTSVSDARLETLQRQVTELQGKQAQLRAIYFEQAPPVQQLIDQLEELEPELDKARAQLLERLERSFQAADERVGSLAAAVEAQRAAMLGQSRSALEFNLLKRDTEVDEKLFQMLSLRLKEAGFMRSLASNTNIRIIDRAEVPLAALPPNTTLLFMGFFVSLVAGLFLAFVIEFYGDKLQTVEDVEDMLRLPALGWIPRARGAAGQLKEWLGQKPALNPLLVKSGALLEPAFVESYRSLRTSVLLASGAQPPRTIVITSNTAGAGKTTTAINTAISLAQAGRRVLLVDADMRHPGCAQEFGVQSDAGLSTHLASPEQPAAVYHDCIPGLDLLPSGPVPPNPSELLSSARLPALLESLSARYDHVLIDSPPLGLVSDALILSVLAEGVILVVKAETDSRRGAVWARETLNRIQARILGVVLNAVDVKRHRYGRYYYGYVTKYMRPYFSKNLPGAAQAANETDSSDSSARSMTLQ